MPQLAYLHSLVPQLVYLHSQVPKLVCLHSQGQAATGKIVAEKGSRRQDGRRPFVQLHGGERGTV